MTFNHEKWISKTIESCLSQTYKNIEICISDDCSSDRTVEIVKSYQRRYPELIKLDVLKENLGKYSIVINGNNGRAMCSGDFLAILDGDERMVPTRIARQVDFLAQNPDFFAVSHNKRMIDAESGQVLPHNPQYNYKEELNTKDLILQGNLFHSCYMMRNNHMLADHSLKIMGDWEFIIRMSRLGRLGFQRDELTEKLIHKDSVTSTRSAQFKQDALITLALLEDKHPELIGLINVRRLMLYLSNIKSGDRRYFIGLFSFSIVTYLRVVFAKLLRLL